jgi:response regulator RpfG family c-di-GMP phosphodiesterase
VRLLLVDDDPGLRALLRATLDAVDVEVDDAADAAVALTTIRRRRPDAIVLDVNLPGLDGLSFCRQLKRERATRDIPIVVLSGSDGGTADAALEAGADSFLRKPFSPLELLAIVERLAGGLYGIPFRATNKKEPQEQLLLYARDLRHLLEIERGQRHLLESAYHETVSALATALETKDTGTRAHSQRVQRYAVELTKAVGRDLIDDQSTEYGFLLHDVGKIGIPDDILLKPGPLTQAERRRMETHTVLGEQMLRGVAFLHGEGLRVVRSHHERWDGTGYPDGIGGTDIPLGARIFAVADALDAMTSDRPYRKAMSWAAAGREILSESKRQFDPQVVEAFTARERSLRSIRREFAALAA